MPFLKLAANLIDTDVLVIGGGIAGCFAAIKACEAGARVVLWEKAAVERSGAASIGSLNWGKLPRPGATEEEISRMADFRSDPRHFWGEPRVLEGIINEKLDLIGVKENWDRVHDLENWGLNMRWDDGEYKLYSSYDGSVSLRYRGTYIKKKLAAKIRQMPIRLMERTMGIDLLVRDGTVVGATGMNVRTGQFVVCKARATVLGAGKVSRLYNPRQGGASGKYKMIGYYVGSGDGHAMAFRAGAEFLNMEIAVSNERNLCSQYDWLSFHFGAFLHASVSVVNARGEKVADRFVHSDKLLEVERSGRGPCFWDPTQLSDQEVREIRGALDIERPIVARFARQRGLDPRTAKYEMTTYKPGELSPLAGVLIGEEGETSLKGLYGAGDMSGGINFGGVKRAAVFGARAGQAAAKYVGSTKLLFIDEGEVERQKEALYKPLSQREGVEPMELEMKIRDIMERYCGAERSEGSLQQGLWRLMSVRDKFLPEMRARNPHELMRVQEVKNLFAMGEIHLLASLERKESGVGNCRLDHPELRDAPWKASIVLRQEGAETAIYRKKMPGLG